MLEGLDEINWKGLGYHVYGQNEKIPDSIRDLLSEDPNTREAARGFLLGEGQDAGDIYDTTSHILAFVIELLAHDETPDRPELLWHLAFLGEKILRAQHPSVAMMRLSLATYDALKAGLPTLTALLAAQSTAVRREAANLLQYMTDQVQVLAPLLLERFRVDQDGEVQLQILRSLKTLFGFLEWTRKRLRDEFTPLLGEIIKHHSDPRMRAAAARAAVELVPEPRVTPWPLSSEVTRVLEQEYIERAFSSGGTASPDDFYELEQLMQDLARLERDALLRLLRDPRNTPEQAHLVARGLLANTYLFTAKESRLYWSYHLDLHRTEGLFYALIQGIWVHPGAQSALQAIVDTDRVWDKPTNVFSFFFGLPDSREALRAML